MKRALEHPVATGLALWCVLRAAARVSWHEPRQDLPELIRALRSAPRSRAVVDRSLVDGILERLLPIVPPWGAGRCVKRSLLQLDLWSRAGLAPRFHVGFFAGKTREGHVWVTAEASAPIAGLVETWSA